MLEYNVISVIYRWGQTSLSIWYLLLNPHRIECTSPLVLLS